MTRDKGKPETIPYNENELTPNIFYKYIVSNIPDFTQRIETVEQLEHYRDLATNININKVLYLSSKNKITEEYKTIASEFKDRLLFAFVP